MLDGCSMNRSKGLARGIAVLTVGGVLLSSCSSMPAAKSGPTFQDYLAIEDAMHDYHYGLDTRDDKLKASAFTKTGRLATVVDGKEIGVEYPNQPERNSGRAGPAPAAAGPQGGAGPPPGAGGPPQGAGGPPPGAAGEFQAKGELWHLAYPAHLKFESATRATSYGYWTSLYSEAKGPRDSQVGSPGHYEDTFEKQSDGRWLFAERKVVVGTKK
jgi:hypothetical protein